MSKFADPIYEPPLSEEAKKRWNEERRRSDRVSELKDGFTFRPNGRLGFIYYREGDRFIELVWELAGPDSSDIIVFLAGLRRWAIPNDEALGEDKQREVETSLRAWLQSNRIRAVFEEGASA